MNRIKLIFTLIAVAILFTIMSCKKDTLDFGSATYFGIKKVLKSENCDADCGETADCEGEMIKVKGKLDESNINVSDNQFYLIDEGDSDFRLEVQVDEMVNDDVFQKINGMGGEVFLAEGEMEGYDAPTNATCKRQFLLRVNDAEKVEME